MMVPRLDKSKKPASLSKRIERFYDNPPGGRTLWVVVTGIGLVFVIFMGRLQYLNEHWDVLRRPVCLSAGGLLFLVYLLVPLSIYAVTHP